MTKATLFVLCFLCAAAALGQSASGALSSEPQVFHPPDHAQHAAQLPMGEEHNLLESSGYAYAQGERPLWELAPVSHAVPLGDVARMMKKEHAAAKKADFVRND
jgi:hypothetical protein